MSKLHFPKHVIIPGCIAQNDKIPDGAQKFYGIINGLAHSNGYAYGSDEDFADLMNKDVRTVQRWFDILEKETSLRRFTKMHRNSDEKMKEKGVQRWQKYRKIYIGNGDSNKDCEPDKNVSSLGPDKNVSSTGPDKNVSYKNKVSYLKSSNKKDNVSETMSSSTKKKKEKKDFSKALDQKQKEAFDKVMSQKPQWGEPPKPNDVCAWMLHLKHSPERILEVLKVYIQDCDDASKRNSKVDRMGGCMRNALNRKRIPRNTDFEANKSLAKRKSAKHRFLEMTKDYVKIRANTFREELEFDMRHTQFLQALEKFIGTAMIYV